MWYHRDSIQVFFFTLQCYSCGNRKWFWQIFWYHSVEAPSSLHPAQNLMGTDVHLFRRCSPRKTMTKSHLTGHGCRQTFRHRFSLLCDLCDVACHDWWPWMTCGLITRLSRDSKSPVSNPFASLKNIFIYIQNVNKKSFLDKKYSLRPSFYWDQISCWTRFFNIFRPYPLKPRFAEIQKTDVQV